MKTLFLLVLLTRNAAGDINASFVNTDTLDQCREKAQLVEGVFNGAGIPIVESRCIRSELMFSEFSHTISSSMTRHFYLVHVDDGRVDIRPVEDWYACKQQEQQGAGKGRLYCSSSVQTLR
ncbi:MAG: hypothetical protein JSW45_01900 [Thiotrichales bacterium]|nr:MAG: hypothetical protein JSW45_01900 [Thiotrichales bacterium]